MLIIAGHVDVEPSDRDAYVADCKGIVEAARAAPGCLDFSISADIVDPGRVVVYERWDDEDVLLAFRGSGPEGPQQAAILSADVKRYGVDSVGEP